MSNQINQKAIDFLKNRIRSRLAEVADQMGKYRFRLYMAMVDECNDFDELKEMAELDLQMDLFDYVRNEINPMLDEMNMSIADVRRMDIGDIPPLANPLQDYEIEPTEIEELMEDEEANAAMAMMLMNRIKNEPDEEKYRQEILDFQLEEKPDIDSIDDISDSDNELDSLLSDNDEDDEFEDLSDLDSLLDAEVDEDSENEDEQNEDPDMEELAGFFDDAPDESEIEHGVMSEDEIFIDSDDLDSLDNMIDADDSKMSADEIFIDDESEIEGLTDSEEQDPFADLDMSDYDFDDTDEKDIDDIDDDDFEGLESDSDDFLDDDDEVVESHSSSNDPFSDIDIDDFDDEQSESADDSDKDDDPFGGIDESELDGMFDSDESSDTEPEPDNSDEDPFGDINESDFGDFDDFDQSDDKNDDDPFGDLDESELDSMLDEPSDKSSKDDNDPFSDIDDSDLDGIGVIDDSDDYLSETKPVKSTPNKKPNNAIVHTAERPTRASGIKPTTVFNNGTQQGMKTQSMFNMFNNIGIGSAKAASKLKARAKKTSGPSFLSMGFNDNDEEIDF